MIDLTNDVDLQKASSGQIRLGGLTVNLYRYNIWSKAKSARSRDNAGVWLPISTLRSQREVEMNNETDTRRILTWLCEGVFDCVQVCASRLHPFG
jgi:hypothetical protein